jgi:signal transduction histidine kinase
MMRGIGFALLFAMAWFSSYPIGFYRVVATGPAIALGGGIISSVLLLYIILSDRRQKALVQHTQRLYQDRMAAAALQFERDERVRQQEFLVMLTHELKAPLSAVGMVLHSAQVSASMRQHADKALAAMKRFFMQGLPFGSVAPPASTARGSGRLRALRSSARRR